MSHTFDIENETNKQLFKSLGTLYFEGDPVSPLLHLNIIISSLKYHYDDFETLNN